MKLIQYFGILLLLINLTGFAKSSNDLKPMNLNDDDWKNLKSATEEEIIFASDGLASDQFGFSVSIFADRALISAPGTNSETGAVYIYDLVDGVWKETAKLEANDKDIGDKFGYSVSLYENRALISAYLDDDNAINTGSAYIFELSGDTWIQTAKLTANDAVTGDFFGFSVSLYGNRALIGAYSTNDTFVNSGSAYVFDLSAGIWNQTDKLVSATPALDERFGYSVSLGEDRALLGARLTDGNFVDSGAAYVFDFNLGLWGQTQKLVANDGEQSDEFGYSVSLLGDRALIGAPFSNKNSGNSGSAYVFDFFGNSWNHTVKLIASDASTNDLFGVSVSLSDNQAVIGSVLDDDNGDDSGSAYIFDRSLGGWSQTAKLKASDGFGGDSFGVSVGVSDYRALVGANLKGVNDVGAAYVYKINQSPLATDDSITVLENSPEIIISVLDNDTDSDAGLISIISATQPSHGVVVDFSNLIMYQPNIGYCNDGLLEDTFTYTLNGGSVATVSIRVICTFTISGTVSGLTNANTVNLQNNNTNNLNVFDNGSFVFTQAHVDGSYYEVSVLTQPNNPNQTCVLSNPSGLISSVDVADILLECNSAPVTANDNYSTIEDGILDVVAGDLFFNDNDEEIDTLSVANPGIYNTDGIGGLMFIESDGSFSYLPPDDLFGLSSFTYDVTDGINQVESTIIMEVIAVNDAPSFILQGDIDATALISTQNTHLSIVNFASDFVMGPANESAQQVMQFNVEIYSDFNNVITSAGIDSITGTLNLEFTQKYGAAILHVTMQDNGGVINNGEDLSTTHEFIVSYTDLIYSDGFETNIPMKPFDLLNTIKLKSSYIIQPYYDSATDSFIYYGHVLKLNNEYSSNQMLIIAQYWLDEIFNKEEYDYK